VGIIFNLSMIEKIKEILQAVNMNTSNRQKGWNMARIDGVSVFESRNVLEAKSDFSKQVWLAKTTGTCDDKLQNLLDKKRDPKKLWTKVLSLKTVFLSQIAELKADVDKAKFNKAKFTAKENPKIFQRMEATVRSKIEAHNQVIDDLISKLSELETECFGDASKEQAAINSEIERLRGQKLEFRVAAVRSPQKTPVKVNSKSEYEAFRYVYKPPVQNRNNPFEPQWWWVVPIIIAAPAVVLAW
jgi:HrpA-like RNA helicase